MYKRLLVTLGLVLAVSASPAQAVPVLIDPDGGGPQGAILVGSLDWNVGNAISIGVTNPVVVNDTFQTYAHSDLSAFNAPTPGGQITGTGLGSAYEWTFTAGAQEIVVAGGTAAVFATIAGPENFFRIFYDPTIDANHLAGTGFNDGGTDAVLILEGTVVPGGIANFTTTGGGLGTPLDAFGANDYPAISSVTGVGGGNIDVAVFFSDPLFFPTSPQVINLNFATAQILNYELQDPSASFTNAADATIVPGAGLGNNLGTCNGCAGFPGTDVMFQQDAASTFDVVPVPGTLILLGSGLALFSLSGIARHRR